MACQVVARLCIQYNEAPLKELHGNIGTPVLRVDGGEAKIQF